MKNEKESGFLAETLKQSFFMRIISGIYHYLIIGFFGKLFTSYSNEDRILKSSRFIQLFTVRHTEKSLRERIAKSFESSAIISKITDFSYGLIHRKMRTYGIFLLSLGFYGIGIYVIQEFALIGSQGNDVNLFISIGSLIVSLPFLLSKDTFAESVLESKFFFGLLFHFLGIPQDIFLKKEKASNRFGLSMFIGMSLGILTYYFNVVYYIIAIVILLLIVVIFTYPEAGVIVLISAIPISGVFSHSALILAGIILPTFFSYLFKIFCGKRTFKVRLCDFCVLFLMAIYFLNGIITRGGIESFLSSMLYVIFFLAYLLIVNLFRHPDWFRRAVTAFVFFGTIAAIVGIVQIFIGTPNPSWTDTSMLGNTLVRVTAFFDTPNIFAEYLLLLIPFVLALIFQKSNGYVLGIRIIVLLLCLASFVFTWSDGAWLGLLSLLPLFFFAFSRYSVPVLTLIGLSSPFIVSALPEKVIGRFRTIGDLVGSPNSFRFSAWKETWELLRRTWFCGIGIGDGSLEKLSPFFAPLGLESVHQTYNFTLKLLIELGIPGFLAFIFGMFFFLQNCFEYLLVFRNKNGREFVIAGMTGIFGLLIMGVTEHIWADFRIFLMFWIIVALINAYIRICYSDRGRISNLNYVSDSAAEIDL